MIQSSRIKLVSYVNALVKYYQPKSPKERDHLEDIMMM